MGSEVREWEERERKGGRLGLMRVTWSCREAPCEGRGKASLVVCCWALSAVHTRLR